MTITELPGRLAPAAGPIITEPGVYEMTNEQYHADPVPGGSLSSTGARRLLECPAKFRWEQDHRQAPKAEFDFGTAAHQEVLGRGDGIVVVDADSWRTNAAKAAADEARARGMVPLLPRDYAVVQAMADAIRRHPIAGPLFSGAGVAEESLFWRDEATGVWRRARPDWRVGRILADYKTTTDASDEAISKTILNYGYHLQGDWYRAGARALGLIEEPAFLLVFQEKAAPYLVHVVEMTAVTLRIGHHRNRQALALYRECVESGYWPGYGETQPGLVSLPPWAEKSELESMQ
nr:hypothetical protein KitaXyl93_20370 [Kitasatospora sp. Xyl93]